MTLRLTPVASVAFVMLSACAALNHAAPRDRHPEIVAGTTEGTAPAALSVVTYNVHDQGGATIAKAFTGSAELAAADLVFLQEVRWPRGPCSDACTAAARLGLSSVYAPSHREGPGTEGVAILSRWPLRDVQVIELPYHDQVWNSARRIALAATIDTAAGPLRVFAVHLDNRQNPKRRASQLAPVLAAARAFDGSVLIGGDMNTSPFVWLGSVVPVPAGVQGHRLERAVRAAGLDTPVVHSGPTSKWLGMRLDALYTRGVRVTSYGVDQAVRISDHLPMWAKVLVTGGAAAAQSVATR